MRCVILTGNAWPIKLATFDWCKSIRILQIRSIVSSNKIATSVFPVIMGSLLLVIFSGKLSVACFFICKQCSRRCRSGHTVSGPCHEETRDVNCRIDLVSSRPLPVAKQQVHISSDTLCTKNSNSIFLKIIQIKISTERNSRALVLRSNQSSAEISSYYVS